MRRLFVSCLAAMAVALITVWPFAGGRGGAYVDQPPVTHGATRNIDTGRFDCAQDRPSTATPKGGHSALASFRAPVYISGLIVAGGAPCGGE